MHHPSHACCKKYPRDTAAAFFICVIHALIVNFLPFQTRRSSQQLRHAAKDGTAARTYVPGWQVAVRTEKRAMQAEDANAVLRKYGRTGGLVLQCQKPGILTLRACRAWAGRTKHRAQTFADLSQTCMMSMPSPGLSCPGPIAGKPTHGHPASSVCLCVCAGRGTRYCARRQGIIVRGSTCCGPHRVTNHHCLLNRMYSVESVQTHV